MTARRIKPRSIPATTPDSVSVEPILQDLREREVAPSTLLLDQVYTSATSLVEQAKHGTQIVGPLQESTRGPGASRRRLWTVRLWGGLAAAARFLSGIGHLSQRWAPFLDRHGTEKIEVRFPAKTCQECVARTHCTTGARDAFSSSCPWQAYQALESRRQEQHTTAFQQAYALRAGIEGRFHKECVGPECDGVPIVESGRHICIMCRLQLGSMCFASSRIFMHKRKSKPSRSSSSSLPLCSSQGGGSTVTFRCLNYISQQSHK